MLSVVIAHRNHIGTGTLRIPMHADHAEIFRTLLSGDPTAPARLVDAALGPLTSVLRRQNPALPRDMIEDAAIDALLVVIERPEAYQPDRGSLLNYLLRIARHKLIDAWRAVQRRREFSAGGSVELELWESNNPQEGQRVSDPANIAGDPDEIPAALLGLVDELLTDPIDRRI